MPQTQRRVVGMLFAAIAGAFFGLNFTPNKYIQNHSTDVHSIYFNASPAGLDYVFAQFNGIFVTSTGYMMVYCILTGNKPHVHNEIIFPAFISGAMWAVAQIAWFVANDCLSQSISFPLVCSGPMLVSNLIGITMGEVRGNRNFAFLVCAGLFTVLADILVSLSKA